MLWSCLRRHIHLYLLHLHRTKFIQHHIGRTVPLSELGLEEIEKALEKAEVSPKESLSQLVKASVWPLVSDIPLSASPLIRIQYSRTPSRFKRLISIPDTPSPQSRCLEAIYWKHQYNIACGRPFSADEDLPTTSSTKLPSKLLVLLCCGSWRNRRSRYLRSEKEEDSSGEPLLKRE